MQTARYAKSLSLLHEESTDSEQVGFLQVKPLQEGNDENHSHVNLLDASVKYRFLSGNFPKRQFEVFIGEMPASCHNPPRSHEGEEFGYVLEGRVKLTIGKESYNIGPGDSYHLMSTTPHICGTNDEAGAKVLWAQAIKYPRLLTDIRREGTSSKTEKGITVKSR